MKNAYFILAIFLSFSLSNHAQSWYPANNPQGGLVFQLVSTPENHLLAGTGAGIYKSTDNGDTWTHLPNEYGNLAVPSMAVAPDGTYISRFSIFVQRSSNGGATWETINMEGIGTPNEFRYNDDGVLFMTTNNHIWRSDDHGDTWTQKIITANTPSVQCLEISPDGELFVGTFNSKIYRSGDDGDTWSEVIQTESDVVTIDFFGDNHVYAGTRFDGIIKSEDNGDTWNPLNALPNAIGASELLVADEGDLVVAASDEVGLYRSEDDGNSWSDISYNLQSKDILSFFLSQDDQVFLSGRYIGIHELSGTNWTVKNNGINATVIEDFEGDNSGNLIACTWQGVYVSSDEGQSWLQSIQGMEDPEILAFASAPNGDWFAGGEFMYRSSDGINWTVISQQFPDNEMYVEDIEILPDGRIIAATDEYGIRYSDDNGASWEVANQGLEDVTMNFIKSSSNGTLYTADGYNLYRTTDLGSTWEIINTGLADTDVESFEVGSGVLYAATYSDGLFRSTDNGDTWTLAIDHDFSDLAVNANEVYGALEAVIGGGVFYSSDNGETWEQINGNLMDPQADLVAYASGLGLFANIRNEGLYTLDFSVNSVSDQEVSPFALKAFPNPSANFTNFQFDLKSSGHLRIHITDITGKTVDQIQMNNLPAGAHFMTYDHELVNGLYLCRFIQNDQAETIRLVVSDF